MKQGWQARWFERMFPKVTGICLLGSLLVATWEGSECPLGWAQPSYPPQGGEGRELLALEPAAAVLPCDSDGLDASRTASPIHLLL